MNEYKVRSKNDRNGNSYGLIINNETRTYKKGYSLIAWSYDLEVPNKKAIYDIIEILENAGYTEETEA